MSSDKIYYCYTLTRPYETTLIAYVGIGKGHRAFSHHNKLVKQKLKVAQQKRRQRERDGSL